MPDPAALALGYLFGPAPVVALRLDPSLRILEASDHARLLLGDSAVGSSLSDFLLGFLTSSDILLLAARPGEPHLLSLSTLHGEPESFRFRFFPLDPGILAIGDQDPLEQTRLRKQLLAINSDLGNCARQLHLAQAELRDLGKLKNQFLAMAAHDLRQPISAVLLGCECVLQECPGVLDPEHQALLQSCVAAAIDMKNMVENFLDSAVMESGHLRLHPEKVAPARFVETLLPYVRPVAGRKDIEILLDIAHPEDTFAADPTLLRQVLLNLLTNAIQHSHPGRRVWLSSHHHAGVRHFSVRDEGVGLTPLQQARLFSAFAEIGTSKTANERSLGLGLALARLIVQAHGGRLWVESVPGAGSTFSLSLPPLSPPESAPRMCCP